MRLNGKRIVEVMGARNLTEETVCSRTGLYQKSFQWIVKDGFASEDAAERITDAVGVAVGEDFASKTIRGRTAAADVGEIERE